MHKSPAGAPLQPQPSADALVARSVETDAEAATVRRASLNKIKKGNTLSGLA